MSFEFLSYISLYLILAIFTAVLFYKLFIKYRYNEMLKIDCDKIDYIDESKFICGLDLSDVEESVVCCVLVSIFIVFVIQNKILFKTEPFYSSGTIKNLDFIACLSFCASYWIPGSIIAYLRRTHKKYKENYQEFLYWECFIYKGKKFKLFWDDKKYRKNSNLTIGKKEVHIQAEHEKKFVKISAVVIVVLLMILPVSQALSLEYFDEDKILISYRRYDYSDITEIYNVDKFKNMFGNIKDKDFIAVVLGDGRIFRKYAETNNNVSNDEFLRFISQKGDIDPIECEFLPSYLD